MHTKSKLMQTNRIDIIYKLNVWNLFCVAFTLCHFPNFKRRDRKTHETHSIKSQLRVYGNYIYVCDERDDDNVHFELIIRQSVHDASGISIVKKKAKPHKTNNQNNNIL